MRRLARLLDSSVRIPGTSWTFGLDAVIGLVPGVGDAAGLAASALVIGQAIRLGARGWTVARMLVVATVDALVGLVPVIGTVFDVAFKANERNVRLLEDHLRDPEQARARSRRTVIRTIAAVTAVTVLVSAALLAGLVALLRWVF